MNLVTTIQALMGSRKSVVGAGAMVLVGLVYFFGRGELTEKMTVMAAVSGIAVSIITAIGKEDAAAKASPMNVATVTTNAAPAVEEPK